MPYVRLESNVPIPEGFIERTSVLVADALGKGEEWVMVNAYECDLFFAGSYDPAAYVRLESLGLAASACPPLVASLSEHLQAELGIPPDRQYVDLVAPERARFGWNGTTFG